MSTYSSHGTAPSAGTPRSLDIIRRDFEKRSGETTEGDYAKNFKNKSYDTSLDDDPSSNTDGKPALPYTVGAKFVARRHEPPAPFGHDYDTPWPPFKTGDFRRPHIDCCLIRQPIEGRTLDESGVLTITESIRTGYTYGAQVVIVAGNIVAKIYDPLYDAGGDCYDNKRDVVVLADGDYTREAAAYDQLRRDPETLSLVPEYYGSWTIEVPTTVSDETFTRHVRLILIEHINGTVMSSVQPQLLSRQTRSSIIEKVLEAESLVFNAGVLHRDMSPRNVMLVSPSPTSSFDDPDLRVVIIDFNVSNVIRLSNASCQPSDNPSPTSLQKQWPGKLLGPVTRFWNAMEEFEARDWVNDEDGKANEWLWECFGQRQEYVPLVRDREERELCPRISWYSGRDNGDGDDVDMTVEDTEDSSCAGDGDDEVVFQGRGCKGSALALRFRT
ncbi:hypothetical protein G6011_07926 [Alternaria panax]|uniref:non-specific serine/threonine protein kinase n=1 Tax=Alternaria panax TaxID=48097 RepID=A0AAD4I4V1_9PLEO|nr:hypothetical protein G6011_07926 [Alternaria panax]